MDDIAILNLSSAAVLRLAKEATPFTASFAHDAKTAISHAATLFILYGSTKASKIALGQKRKTVQAADVMKFLKTNGFASIAAKLALPENGTTTSASETDCATSDVVGKEKNDENT
uniref:DNA polymerase epsilon subunit 3 n=1 Tax=Trichuris muris TaxID=70415 RepID=A0A5S6QF09_TRIMR